MKIEAAQQHQPQPFASELLAYDAYQLENPADAEMRRGYVEFAESIGSKSELEVNLFLQNQMMAAAAGDVKKRHAEIMSSLVYGILSRSSVALQYYQFACLCSRDNFDVVVGRLKYFAGPMFARVQAPVRVQIIWLTQQLIDKAAQRIDEVVLLLLKNIQGGITSASDNNVWLVDQLVSMLTTKREWTRQHHGIISTSVFVFLRSLLDHHAVSTLRKKLVSYCLETLRENFLECSYVGRDLVRALWEASFLEPEINGLYRSLMANQLNVANVVDVKKLLATPTPKHFLQCRLTPEMESYLLFILEKVEWGRNDDTYFQWFADMFVDTATASQSSLVADILRYVVCCFHPPNALLQSRIVPRYAVVGKLLKAVKNRSVSAGMKMAIFWDWICFDPQKDSIMNIEPGALLMDRSVDKYTHITQWSLEFVSYLATDFCPSLSPFMSHNAAMAFETALKKGVLRSRDHMLQAPNLDAECKAILTNLLKCMDDEPEDEVVTLSSPPPLVAPENVVVVVPDVIVVDADDDDQDKTATDELTNDNMAVDAVESLPVALADQLGAADTDELWMFGNEITNLASAISARDRNAAREAMHRITQVASKMETPLKSLCMAVRKIVGAEPALEYENINLVFDFDQRPFMAHNLLLSEWNDSKLSGYLLRYLLEADEQRSNSALADYVGFLKELNTPTELSLQDRFDADLQYLESACPQLLAERLPDLFKQAAAQQLDTQKMARNTISALDPAQAYAFCWQLLRDSTSIMSDRQFVDMMAESLTWDGYEQQNYWQFLSVHMAHNLSLWQCFAGALGEFCAGFDSQEYPEAAWGILSIVQARPVSDLSVAVLTGLMQSPVNKYPMSTIVLQHCGRRLPAEEFAALVGQLEGSGDVNVVAHLAHFNSNRKDNQ